MIASFILGFFTTTSLYWLHRLTTKPQEVTLGIKEDIQVQIQHKQLEIKQLECQLYSEDHGGPFR